MFAHWQQAAADPPLREAGGGTTWLSTASATQVAGVALTTLAAAYLWVEYNNQGDDGSGVPGGSQITQGSAYIVPEVPRRAQGPLIPQGPHSEKGANETGKYDRVLPMELPAAVAADWLDHDLNEMDREAYAISADSSLTNAEKNARINAILLRMERLVPHARAGRRPSKSPVASTGVRSTPTYDTGGDVSSADRRVNEIYRRMRRINALLPQTDVDYEPVYPPTSHYKYSESAKNERKWLGTGLVAAGVLGGFAVTSMTGRTPHEVDTRALSALSTAQFLQSINFEEVGMSMMSFYSRQRLNWVSPDRGTNATLSYGTPEYISTLEDRLQQTSEVADALRESILQGEEADSDYSEKLGQCEIRIRALVDELGTAYLQQNKQHSVVAQLLALKKSLLNELPRATVAHVEEIGHMFQVYPGGGVPEGARVSLRALVMLNQVDKLFERKHNSERRVREGPGHAWRIGKVFTLSDQLFCVRERLQFRKALLDQGAAPLPELLAPELQDERDWLERALGYQKNGGL